MAGQLIQHRVYISGIEVPASRIQISSVPNAVWQGSVVMPWSPFLMKLPKGTKITIFKRNSDLFNHFRLLCDGTIVSISESKSWGGSSTLQLGIMSDAAIFSWRKMAITPLELQFSSEFMTLANQAAEENMTTSPLNSVVPPGLALWVDAKDVGNDACKAAALWLTGIPAGKTDSTDGQPVSQRQYYDSQQGKIIGGKDGRSDAYPHLSAFLAKFYGDYRVAKKVTYVPLPKSYQDAIGVEEMWSLMTSNIAQVKGMVTYWQVATHISSMFQGTILSIPDCTFSKKGLGEIVIMPHNFFGRATLCNIVFPDQVMEKSNSVNYGAEQTRAFLAGPSLPMKTQSIYDGMYQWSYTAPHGMSGVLKALNLSDKAGIRSTYEEQYGVSAVEAPLGKSLVLALQNSVTNDQDHKDNKNTVVKPPKALEHILNHEFIIAYSQKFSMTIRVQPDVEAVPGAALIILDEAGEHTVAYCAGTSYAWDANGQTVVQVQVAYPHHYSWSFENATQIGNVLSGNQNPEAVKTYETIVGSKVSPDENDKTALKYFDSWREDFNQDSRRMKYADLNKTKGDGTGIMRKICTMEEFVNFMSGYDAWAEIKDQDFNADDGYTTLGEGLINQFDSTFEAPRLSTAAYTYWDPVTKKSIPSQPIRPEFKTIGKPGDIVPSTYVSGIVDCHLKWLLQIGHVMSI